MSLTSLIVKIIIIDYFDRLSFLFYIEYQNFHFCHLCNFLWSHHNEFIVKLMTSD